jgi:hypothetical protein
MCTQIHDLICIVPITTYLLGNRLIKDTPIQPRHLGPEVMKDKEDTLEGSFVRHESLPCDAL